MVDWDGLENRCAFTGTVGSNPTLSATVFPYAVLLATCGRSSETVRHIEMPGAMLFWLAGCVFAAPVRS